MNNKQLKFGVILSYISLALGLIINLVFTPVLLKQLGQEEYGVFTLATSVTSYLGLLEFGFSSTYIFFYSKYKRQNDETGLAYLNGIIIKIYMIIGVIASIIGVVLSHNIHKVFTSSLKPENVAEFQYIIVILSFNIAINFLLSVFSAYITANERFIFIKIISIIVTILKPVLTITLVILGLKSIGVAIASFIITLCEILIYYLFCKLRLNMRISFKAYDIRLLKRIISYSSFVFLIMIADTINWNVDKVLLGAYRTTIDLSIYGLAAQLNSIFMVLSTSISSVYTPRVHLIQAENCSENEKNTRLLDLLISIGKTQFIILSLVLSGFVVFGTNFINLWVGAEYGDAYYILLLLFGSELFPLILNVGIEIQRAKNKQKIPTYVAFAQAIINFIISIPLCIKFGAIGCAFGTAFAMICSLIFKNYYYNNVLKLNMHIFWKKILKLLFIAIGFCLIAYFSLNHLILNSFGLLLFAILLYTGLYLSCIFVMGLNGVEKNKIMRLMCNFLEKCRLFHI